MCSSLWALLDREHSPPWGVKMDDQQNGVCLHQNTPGDLPGMRGGGGTTYWVHKSGRFKQFIKYKFSNFVIQTLKEVATTLLILKCSTNYCVYVRTVVYYLKRFGNLVDSALYRTALNLLKLLFFFIENDKNVSYFFQKSKIFFM